MLPMLRVYLAGTKVVGNGIVEMCRGKNIFPDLYPELVDDWVVGEDVVQVVLECSVDGKEWYCMSMSGSRE